MGGPPWPATDGFRVAHRRPARRGNAPGRVDRRATRRTRTACSVLPPSPRYRPQCTTVRRGGLCAGIRVNDRSLASESPLSLPLARTMMDPTNGGVCRCLLLLLLSWWRLAVAAGDSPNTLRLVHAVRDDYCVDGISSNVLLSVFTGRLCTLLSFIRSKKKKKKQ